MPKNKKLQNQIENKLEKLSKLLDKIIEANVINSDDTDTWDSDALYNLVESLKDALKLLEDKVIPSKYDELGQPLTEEGLCSLVDTYQEEENSEEI